MINCRTLGPVELTTAPDNAPVALRGNKNVALLIYLARSLTKSRTRDHLIGLFWADKPDTLARGSLREALRVLRITLGEDAVQTEGEQIRLMTGAVRLDTDRFEQFEANHNWQCAAELIAGDFLEGLRVRQASAFEDWLTTERLHWRRRSIAALVNYSDMLLAAGQTGRAASLALRAHGLDPGSGTAIRAAMKCLALAGDRTVALACYNTYQKQLDEVAAEPEREVQQLAERVQRERSWRLPPSVPTTDERGAELRRVPLVGRQQELARLVYAWSETISQSRASVTVIEGDWGLGKTRLCEELTARARLDGAAVATFRAVAGDLAYGGAAILGLAKGGLLHGSGLATAKPQALSAFAQHIAEWADRFGVAPGDTLPLDRAFVDIVRALGEEQPTLLFVDDAQWCDSDSLLALVALMRDASTLPVLLCLAFAPEPQRRELDELRSRLHRDVPGTTIHLKKLDNDALLELARWAMPKYDDEQVDRLARRVASDSACVPVLAVELLHAVAIGLDLEATSGAWPAPFRTLSQTLPNALPDAIVAAIKIGFRKLSAPAQDALISLSVLDERSAPEQLCKATGLDREAVDSALDELEWQRWLTADASGYSFVAGIARDVVAQDMLTEGKRLRILKRLEA